MYKPVRKQLRPQFAEMIQFSGWTNAGIIFDWCGKTFFVGEGYEHRMRRENEKDRGNGHIHDYAPSFLVLEQSDGKKVRVDLGDWVVLGGNNGDDLGKMTDDEVKQFYVDLDPIENTK